MTMRNEIQRVPAGASHPEPLTVAEPCEPVSALHQRAAICAKCYAVKMSATPFQLGLNSTSNTNPSCAKCWVAVMPTF